MAIGFGGSFRRCLLAVVLGALVFAPGEARAAAGAGAGVMFPSTVTVGQTGLPASITLENRNTAPNAGDTNTVCNAGDPSPPCSSPERGIVLVPSCKQVTSGQCMTADPGVFQLSSTGSGRAGTSCEGTVFDIALVDPAFGTVGFTPRPTGAHVTLGIGATCVIDFTFDVLRSPAGDQDPSTPGSQTAQTTDHTQVAGPFAPGSPSSLASATSSGTTVQRATPTIATSASANITLGAGRLTDKATVSGRVNPQAGATVDFRLYGPADATCSRTPVFQALDAPYPVAGGTVTSSPFTPTKAGTYRWIASYSGDADNAPVTGACNDINETTTVAPTPPPPSKPKPKPAPGKPKPAPGKPRTPALSIAARPNPLVFGAVTTISGQLTGASKKSGISVTLLRNRYPYTGGYQAVASTTTDSQGRYAFTRRPRRNERYQAVAKPNPGAPVTSPAVHVGVRPRVTLHLSDPTPARGQRVRFRGSVYPAHDGRTVYLQRRTRTGRYVTLARTRLRHVRGSRRSSFRRVLRIYHSGTYRAYLPRHADHSAGVARRSILVH